MKAYTICKQKYPDVLRPFIIVEVTITSDGPRSRICTGAWHTYDQAFMNMQARIEADKR